MQLVYEEQDLFGDYLLINYTKLVKDSKELCIVCQVDETEYGQQFDRYQLACHHIAHTRCLRRWCTRKEKLNCPYCGNIKRKIINRYCQECYKFGHAFGDDGCPLSNFRYTKLSNVMQ